MVYISYTAILAELAILKKHAGFNHLGGGGGGGY